MYKQLLLSPKMNGRKKKVGSSKTLKTPVSKKASTVTTPTGRYHSFHLQRKQTYLNNIGLTKIFSKVKTDASQNGTSDLNIYEIKDAKTIQRNLAAEVCPINNEVDEISTCSQIPGLTDEDLKEIIQISELEEFLENNNFEDFTCDSTMTPSIGFPTLPSPPAIDSSESSNATCDSTLTPHLGFNISPTATESIVQHHHENPLDLSIKKVEIPKSALMLSNSSFIPLRSSMLPLNPSSHMHNDNYSRCVRKAHRTSFPQAVRKSQLKYKKSSYAPSSTTTSYSTKTNNNLMGTTTAAGQEHQLKQVQQVSMMPSTILEEILGLQGIIPTYELLTVGEATYFNPIYRYRVSFHNQHAYGNGKSTQDAKNSAARALLDNLTNNKYFGNVIGHLQELCMARNWPLPQYEEVMEITTKEGRDFITSCTVLQCKEYGQGRTKKISKLLSAYKIKMKLTTDGFQVNH